MNELLKPAVTAVCERFDGKESDFRGDVTVLLPAEKVVDAATVLRDEFDFDMLSAETAVDYYPQTTPRFHMVYISFIQPKNVFISLSVQP